MAEVDPTARLSQVQTLWTVVCQAHPGGPPDEVRAAQDQLMARYRGVVHRYLLGALRDAHAAEELTQEFALRFVRGDLKGADPARGRFRDFLKGVLFNLIGDHYRRRKREPRSLPADHDPAAPSENAVLSDVQFVESWRNELLNRAWKSLAEFEKRAGQPYYSVLHMRAENVELRSTDLADVLSQQLNKPLTSSWVRQNLHRAREKFAEILVDEVAQTLVSPTLHDLELELIHVDLYEYCRPMLQQLRSTLSIGNALKDASAK